MKVFIVQCVEHYYYLILHVYHVELHVYHVEQR